MYYAHRRGRPVATTPNLTEAVLVAMYHGPGSCVTDEERMLVLIPQTDEFPIDPATLEHLRALVVRARETEERILVRRRKVIPLFKWNEAFPEGDPDDASMEE